jgi:hypothetical protein
LPDPQSYHQASHFSIFTQIIFINRCFNQPIPRTRKVIDGACFGLIIHLPITPQLKINDIFVCQLFQAPIAKVGQEVFLNTPFVAIKLNSRAFHINLLP